MLSNNDMHSFTVELLQVQSLIKIISMYFYCTVTEEFFNRSTDGRINDLHMK